MPVHVGEEVEVVVEKPASGGRMIARHEGEVLLVLGAIPGERVAVRVTRAEKRVAFADTVRVLDASEHRRVPAADPACGGCLYAHIRYERQLQLKSDIVRDAFARIGRIPVEGEIPIERSEGRGYRMRARFHVGEGRPGFYREGTHDLCDASATGQVLDASMDAVERAVASLSAQGLTVISLELSENLSADQRALHLEVRGSRVPREALDRVTRAAGLTGCTARAADGESGSSGDPVVTDRLDALTAGRATGGFLRRHPDSFFQANRYVIASLVGAVMDAVPEGPVLELYAGVGLFSVSLAAAGRGDITAVEGDPASGRDLQRNAAPYRGHLRVIRGSVEAFVGSSGRAAPRTLIVDPPRTGMSKEAAQAIGQAGAHRVVYVSCDAPTMARDARRLLDAGYRLVSLRAFDLFPNTPHVESLGVFER